MKIVYCIHSVSNSGGMESVICNKVNYLIEKCGHEVYILTLEQKIDLYSSHFLIK